MVDSQWLSELVRNNVYRDGDVIKMQLERKLMPSNIGMFRTVDDKHISINLQKWDDLTAGTWYNTRVKVNYSNGKMYVNGEYMETDAPVGEYPQQNLMDFSEDFMHDSEPRVDVEDTSTMHTEALYKMEKRLEEIEIERGLLMYMINYFKGD